VSTVVGGNPTAGWYDGVGTHAYVSNIIGLFGDSLGNLYVSDANPGYMVRMVNTTGAAMLV
jgi:hypothetical protein